MKRLLLIAVLALAGCKRTTPGALLDPALAALVPADTTMLVGIRVEDLVKTPIYQKYVAQRPIAPLDEFAKEFGIEPRKDVWELLFISNGKESVVLGRGRFPSEPEKRLERELKGATRTNYKGYTLIGDEETAVMMIGGSVAAMGQTPGLKRIIDTRDKSNGPPAVLAARMKEIPVTAGFWTVYAGTPITLPPGASANAGNMAKVLNSIQSGAFYLDLRTNISGKATGIVSSDAGAKELHDSLRGLLGLGRLMGAKDEVKMQKLFDGLRITLDGRNVNLYIEEQESAIGVVMDFVSRMGQGRPEAPARGVSPLR